MKLSSEETSSKTSLSIIVSITDTFFWDELQIGLLLRLKTFVSTQALTDPTEEDIEWKQELTGEEDRPSQVFSSSTVLSSSTSLAASTNIS